MLIYIFIYQIYIPYMPPMFTHFYGAYLIYFHKQHARMYLTCVNNMISHYSDELAINYII